MPSTRRVSGSDEPAGTPAPSTATSSTPPIGPVQLRRRTWWTTVGVAYGIGAYLLVSILLTERSQAVALMASLASVVTSMAAARLLERDLPGTPPASVAATSRRRAGLMLLATAGAIATLLSAQWADTVWGALLPGLATAALGAQVSPRRRSAIVSAGAALTAVVAAGGQQLALGRIDPTAIANQVLLAIAVAGGLLVARWFWALVHRLERARRAEAELAVAEERLRFAADLHDIQGHHLQVIALHSELATRLADTDVEGAVEQMGQVQQHARTALGETRDLVHGYRRTSLGEELANATRVLESAGVDGRLEPGTASEAAHVREPGRGLLGLLVREATTNILRHSDAQRARLALQVDDNGVHLTIDNDGVQVDPLDGGAGSGLAGLAGRIEAAGGELRWHHEHDRFTVAARVPIAADRPA